MHALWRHALLLLLKLIKRRKPHKLCLTIVTKPTNFLYIQYSYVNNPDDTKYHMNHKQSNLLSHAFHTHDTVADLEFERKGGSHRVHGQSQPGRVAAHHRGVWGHAPSAKLWKYECTEAHCGGSSANLYGAWLAKPSHYRTLSFHCWC